MCPKNIISGDLSDGHKYSSFVQYDYSVPKHIAMLVILKINRNIIRFGSPVELDTAAREMLRFAIKIYPGLTGSSSSNRARGLCLLGKLKIMD